MKRILLICLAVLLVLAIPVSIALWWPVPARYHGEPSDHFDGKHFFNPEGFSQHSFWDVMKWLVRRHPAPWPVWRSQTLQPQLPAALSHQDISVTFINHATTLIQMEGWNVLTDPMWSKRASPFSWMGPKRVQAPGIAFDQLPPIHTVLISHNHYDHMDEDTIKHLEEKFHPLFIVPLGDRDRLISFGVKQVIQLDWWQTMEIKPHVFVTMTPAKHFSARWLNDRNLSLWGGYILSHFHKKIFFAGDTGYASHFQKIYEKFGEMDVALLPIGAYKPREFLSAAHMDPAESVKAHKDLHAKQSLGIHFGTFQLTEEAIDAPIEDLQKALRAAGIDSKRFIAPQAGRTYSFAKGG